VSLFKSILSAAAPIVGGIFGGAPGAAIGSVIGGALAPRVATPSFAPTSMPGAGIMQTMGTLPMITGAVATTARAGIAGARLIISSARYYCARYPGWCLSIGGLGVVEGLVREGKLPVHRRRK